MDRTTRIQMNSTRSVRVSAAFSLLTICIITGGCEATQSDLGTDSDTVSPRVPTMDYSIVWHDSPAVDLKTPLGGFIRATAESYLRGLDFSNIEYSFPGFEQAAANSSPSIAEDTLDGQDWREDEESSWAGAKDLKVDSVSERDGRTIANVCTFQGRLLVESRNPDEYSIGTDSDTALKVIELVFTRTGTQPKLVEPGPAPRPNDPEIFGQWQISSIDYNMRRTAEPARSEARESCEANRGDIPRVPDEDKTVPRNDPLASIAPSPGWSNTPGV